MIHHQSGVFYRLLSCCLSWYASLIALLHICLKQLVFPICIYFSFSQALSWLLLWAIVCGIFSCLESFLLLYYIMVGVLCMPYYIKLFLYSFMVVSKASLWSLSFHSLCPWQHMFACHVTVILHCCELLSYLRCHFFVIYAIHGLFLKLYIMLLIFAIISFNNIIVLWLKFFI